MADPSRPGAVRGRTAHRVAQAVGGVLAAATATLAWSLVEARRPVLRRVDVPCLAPGEDPLTVLHLADLHLTGSTRARVAWVRDLAGLEPDVVMDTGDNLSTADGVEPLREALEPLVGRPGAFALGDHDYRATVFRSPTRYLRRDPRSRDDPTEEPPGLPWHEVRDIQGAGGWRDLTNRRDLLAVRGRSIELVGVDDPHADRDVFPTPGGPDLPSGLTPVLSASGAPLRIGLTHAPYTRVLDAMLDDGADLVLAGHTHGGQLCVPGFGALVTNCDLDRSRASGLSGWRAERGEVRAAVGDPGRSLFLHVSAGLGTSPYTPVRLACRPEATLLTLLPVRSAALHTRGR